jgi:hypothetical protein
LNKKGSPYLVGTTPLATLNRIVELIECAGSLNLKDNWPPGSGLEGEKLFFEYLRKGYAAFLAGGDRLDGLQEDLYPSPTSKNEDSQLAIGSLESQIGTLREEHTKLAKEDVPLLKWQRQRSDLLEDIDKFKKLI